MKKRIKFFLLVMFILLLSVSAFFAQAAESDLAGIIMHNNAPVSNITSSEPAFWFRDESTSQGISGVTTTYDSSTGAYACFNLPNTKIGVSISYHLTGSVTTLPGNYSGWETVDLPVLTPGDTMVYTVPGHGESGITFLI